MSDRSNRRESFVASAVYMMKREKPEERKGAEMRHEREKGMTKE